MYVDIGYILIRQLKIVFVIVYEQRHMQKNDINLVKICSNAVF